ncbi:MAG TPA: hypothetical protein VKY65_00290 [Alphaproteobacteria bacterium]|nr:hypothetical protein [Alphaproteobacteria bacterium]
MMGNWDMAGYGLAHWLIAIVMAAAFLYPIGRILNRIGFSPIWCIVAFIPLLNVIALWVLAFVDWPDGR